MEKPKLKKKEFTKNTVAQNRLRGNPNKAKATIALTLLILGIAFVPTGFLLSNVVQDQLDEGIKDSIKVPHPHNAEFDEWENNDYKGAVHKYKTFYMWNLTNPDAYIAGATPEYEEIGPFVYRQYDTKYEISFSDSKDEVSYKEYNTYNFEVGKSKGNSPEDNITNINPAYLGVLGLAGDEANLIKAMFTSILGKLKEGVIAEIESQLAAFDFLDFAWDFPYTDVTLLGCDIPEAEEVFYGEWAHDRFPEVIFTVFCILLWREIDIPMDITFLDIVGDIDVEKENFNVSGTNPSDLKIIDRDDGDSGLTFEQCQKLWDQNNPYSLTGMDVKVDPIWFDALEDIGESKDILKSTFGLTNTQLNLILDWIDISINDWLKNVCELQINEWNSGLITTRTVEEWLFTGVDNLINEMDPVMAKCGIFDNCHNISEAEAAETVQVTVKTGRDDVNKVGQYVEYNGNEDIMVWAEPLELSGTDGTQFAPGVSKDNEVDAFVDDIMRVAEFEFSKEVDLHGINLYRFKIKDELFDPNPICYMDTQGVANMEPVMGIPARVTKPNFFDADKSLLSKVKGMNPKSSEHDTFLDIEPITGAVMRARKRLQVNLYVTPTDQWYQDLSATIMPILWVQESGEIPKDLAEKFIDVVYGALELKESLPLICIGIGAALITPGVAVSTTQSVKRKKSKISKDLAKNKALAKKQSLTKSSKSQGIETLKDDNQRKFSTIQDLK